MATTDQPLNDRPECIEVVQQEIADARKDARPMSRKALAQIVHQRTGTPLKDSYDIVDAFCEEKEPAIPEYLQSEFVIGWLKVLAVFQVFVGGVFFYYAARAYENKTPYWHLMSLGVIFVGGAVFEWVKSLEREIDIKK